MSLGGITGAACFGRIRRNISLMVKNVIPQTRMTAAACILRMSNRFDGELLWDAFG